MTSATLATAERMAQSINQRLGCRDMNVKKLYFIEMPMAMVDLTKILNGGGCDQPRQVHHAAVVRDWRHPRFECRLLHRRGMSPCNLSNVPAR